MKLGGEHGHNETRMMIFERCKRRRYVMMHSNHMFMICDNAFKTHVYYETNDTSIVAIKLEGLVVYIHREISIG